MSTMRFMSTPLDPKVLPKIFSFDSSPGRAIAQALGNLDEKSYQAELKEELPGDERVYEVTMVSTVGKKERRKVGFIHHMPFSQRGF